MHPGCTQRETSIWLSKVTRLSRWSWRFRDWGSSGERDTGFETISSLKSSAVPCLAIELMRALEGQLDVALLIARLRDQQATDAYEALQRFAATSGTVSAATLMHTLEELHTRTESEG